MGIKCPCLCAVGSRGPTVVHLSGAQSGCLDDTVFWHPVGILLSVIHPALQKQQVGV